MGSGNIAECQRRSKVAPGHSFLKAFNLVLNALPGVPEYSKWAKMSIPGHANLAEYKSGSKCVAPLWQRDLWGEYCPAFLRNIFASRDGTQPNRFLRQVDF